jgi:hypothetical protein
VNAHITVTSAQVAAAQLQIELAAELGEEVSPAVRAIAQATRTAAPRPRGSRTALDPEQAVAVHRWARSNGYDASEPSRLSAIDPELPAPTTTRAASNQDDIPDDSREI